MIFKLSFSQVINLSIHFLLVKVNWYIIATDISQKSYLNCNQKIRIRRTEKRLLIELDYPSA